MTALSSLMGISQTEVYEVATFYHHFDVVDSDKDKPPALTVRVCDSVSCELNGANELAQMLDDYYKGTVNVSKGDTFDRRSFLAKLVHIHYSRNDKV